MDRQKLPLMLLGLLSGVLMSIPWLVPHTGALALIAFVPLLIADEVASQCGIRRFWICHYSTFFLWNALTTFWVCNATVGGGVFAVLANAFQMSVVWGCFRLVKKKLSGVVPYIFLAAMWIAWERFYFDAEISWPWLVLGNAFGRSTRMVQWYEYTGSLGGSLWVWAANLGIFGLIAAFSSDTWARWNDKARFASMLALVVVVGGPVVASRLIYNSYEEQSEGVVDVLIAQPNLDPYQKFEYLSQSQQTDILVNLLDSALAKRPSAGTGNLLLIAPETFTSDVVMGSEKYSPTIQSIDAMLARHPGTEMLMGAATYTISDTRSAPSILARPYGDGWIESHNSALVTSPGRAVESTHKNKLVVGVELTPYPKVFVPLDNWLSGLFGVSGLMGRNVGQDGVKTLHLADDTTFGCAVCYESIYGEYCTDYVRKGARMMTVITNDAWWGNTPGYRQHMSYACLRAIELRRDFVRCGNTGISAIIDQRGEVLDSTSWWTRTTLPGSVNLNSKETFFVQHGDICGRLGTFVFLLLAALYFVRLFVDKRG